MIVRSRAPLRLGLAGGGTDVSPYCDEFGGNVLNATIDRFAWTTLESIEGNSLSIRSTDLGISEDVPLVSVMQDDILGGRLKLHRAVYKHIIDKYNSGHPVPLRITTTCEAPLGSGLGGSSTVVVSIIRAFVEYFNIPLDDYGIANLAIEIERNKCGLAGGKQDQYSAAFGGVNFIEFQKSGSVVVNSLKIKNWIICELEASILLCFTGVSRESANVIESQRGGIQSRSDEVLNSLHKLKNDAFLMKQFLLQGNFEQIITCINNDWENKKKTSKNVSNQRIDKLLDIAKNSGAMAGKVSGAGGGGFIWFFVDPIKRQDVVNSLSQQGAVVSGVHFTKRGAEAWRIQ